MARKKSPVPGFDASHSPTNPLVRESGGVANDVQDHYADALKGVPCPHAISMRDGVYKDEGEMPRTAPGIGYQCDPTGDPCKGGLKSIEPLPGTVDIHRR